MNVLRLMRQALHHAFLPYTSCPHVRSVAQYGGMFWRWLFFLIFIALGVVAGLIYGWVINPAQYTDASPGLLMEDYRTDYVLMVAETFNSGQDLGVAIDRLGYLESPAPVQAVVEAVDFAGRVGYHPDDLLQMRNLLSALQVGTQGGAGSSP